MTIVHGLAEHYKPLQSFYNTLLLGKSRILHPSPHPSAIFAQMGSFHS